MPENNNISGRHDCGGEMKLRRIENDKAIYVCVNCGYMKFKEITDDDKMVMAVKKSDLLSRVEIDMINFSKTTFATWESLKNDIVDFRAKFQPVRYDIDLQIAILACLSQGFKILDDTTYIESQPIFKCIEQFYKQYRKDPSLMSKKVAIYYSIKRRMYIECMIAFLCTKVPRILWPLVKFILKLFFKF